MKALFSVAAMLISSGSLLADEPRPAIPPTPPAVNYEVRGYSWNGQQYVQQPKYSFTTSDLKKATDYVAHINRFAGWTATSNIPLACLPWQTVQTLTIGQQPTVAPAPPTFTVWAFHSIEGNWVRDDKYCWSTTDPVKGTEYAKKVNAVSGWHATDNCPPNVVQRPQQYVFGIPGGRILIDVSGLIRDARKGSLRGTAVESGADPGWDSNWTTSSPAYDNTNDIQNMINTQNMLNTQDMINTQNMVNNIQDMVNTQNMINSMQAN